MTQPDGSIVRVKVDNNLIKDFMADREGTMIEESMTRQKLLDKFEIQSDNESNKSKAIKTILKLLLMELDSKT